MCVNQQKGCLLSVHSFVIFNCFVTHTCEINTFASVEYIYPLALWNRPVYSRFYALLHSACAALWATSGGLNISVQLHVAWREEHKDLQNDGAGARGGPKPPRHVFVSKTLNTRVCSVRASMME